MARDTSPRPTTPSAPVLAGLPLGPLPQLPREELLPAANTLIARWGNDNDLWALLLERALAFLLAGDQSFVVARLPGDAPLLSLTVAGEEPLFPQALVENPSTLGAAFLIVAEVMRMRAMERQRQWRLECERTVTVPYFGPEVFYAEGVWEGTEHADEQRAIWAARRAARRA